MVYFEKDKDAVLDYTTDWSDWLDADIIQSSTWIVPAGVTKDSDSNTTTTATIWLSGGAIHAQYSIINRIVTVGGRTDDRTIIIIITEK